MCVCVASSARACPLDWRLTAYPLTQVEQEDFKERYRRLYCTNGVRTIAAGELVAAVVAQT